MINTRNVVQLFAWLAVLLVAFVAVKVGFVLRFALHGKWVMDEFLAASMPLLIPEGFYGAWDPVKTILTYARGQGITQIFVGHNLRRTWRARLFGTPLDRLIRGAGDIDVRVFPQ